MSSMRKWTEDGGKTTAYLRLGNYLPDEDTLKPSQYTGTFSASDGILMATSGDWYLKTDKAIEVELQGDATLHIGDFATDTDKHLKIDVLEGDKTVSRYTDANGFTHTTTTFSGESGTLKGSSVALNAVTDATSGKTAPTGTLVLNASDKIIVNSDGMSRFTAGVDVAVKNKTTSTFGSNVLQFNLGFVNSIVIGMQGKIVTGLNTGAMVGLRSAFRLHDSKITVNDATFCYGKNEIVLYKKENTGMKGFLIGCTAGVGAIFQYKSMTKTSQQTLGNKSEGGSVRLRMAGVKSKTLSSSMGVRNST
ncbi:hypothetical protein AB7M35_003591 [Amorphus suaedae]